MTAYLLRYCSFPNLDLDLDPGSLVLKVRSLVQLKSDDDSSRCSTAGSTHKSACLRAIQFLASNKYPHVKGTDCQRRILLWAGHLSVWKIRAGIEYRDNAPSNF